MELNEVSLIPPSRCIEDEFVTRSGNRFNGPEALKVMFTSFLFVDCRLVLTFLSLEVYFRLKCYRFNCFSRRISNIAGNK
jgi:hypothetical protein